MSTHMSCLWLPGTSWRWGVIAGLSYVYMAAAWGGYVFVINMVGVHAGILVLVGKYNTTVYRAYTLFFIIGTTGRLPHPQPLTYNR